MKNSNEEPASEVAQAVVKLSQRISALEQVPAAGPSSSENSQNLAPTMRRLRADLSALRTQLITATSDIDERLSELESVKSENAKLKYRIKTLLRSLDAAEKSS